MRKCNYIGLYLLLILIGNSDAEICKTGVFIYNINSVSNRISVKSGGGNNPSVFTVENRIETLKYCGRNKKTGTFDGKTVDFPGSNSISIVPSLDLLNLVGNIFKLYVEFPLVKYFNFNIKSIRQGGNMKNYIASDFIPSVIGKIIFSASLRNKQNENSSSYSSDSEFEYEGNITQITEYNLPSNITDITSKNPAGITLTGKLIVTNALYTLAGKINKKPDNLSLSNTSSTALTRNEGYVIGSFLKAVSNASGNCLFSFGNSTLGNNVSINMTTSDYMSSLAENTELWCLQI